MCILLKFHDTYIFIIKGKLLVTTGLPYENGTNSEIIDLLNVDVTCKDRTKNPKNIAYATGGVVGM